MQLPNSIQTSMVDDSHEEPQTVLMQLCPVPPVLVPQDFDFHGEVSDFHLTDPDAVQDSGQHDSDINIMQFFADISQSCYPMDMLYATRPTAADINVLMARDNAIGASWLPQVRPTPDSIPTSIGSAEPALRATFPAPFFFFAFIPTYIMESIIPLIIRQRLIDRHDMKMYQPMPPFFMPDTRSYAQFKSNFCDHKDAITRQYYSKVPRNPRFHDVMGPRIYPIELLKRLPEHLETYKDAFPEPLPVVVVRQSEVVSNDIPLQSWKMHGSILHVLPTMENCENPENPEDTLWSMVLKRGISDSLRPYGNQSKAVATSPVQFGNMIYSAEELNYFSFAVNVFMELPSLPGPALEEPQAIYKGAFILHVIDFPMEPARWIELSEELKKDIYDRAPQLFDGLPPYSKCPDFPAVNLYFQNWDINMLGVLDDLKFGTVDDATY
ncbi:hypothetical protein DFH29DRAFT_894050 [Suillus ampliporus]|nr:hypothetical protein DFH29DRAFT_894050 [Suillus ampliporus]